MSSLMPLEDEDEDLDLDEAGTSWVFSSFFSLARPEKFFVNVFHGTKSIGHALLFGVFFQVGHECIQGVLFRIGILLLAGLG